MVDFSAIAKHARKVVNRANASGALDAGDFSMGSARRDVCATMGLEEGALDGDEERQMVKKAINEAMDALDGEDGDESEEEKPKKTAKPKAAPKAKPKPKAKSPVKRKPAVKKRSKAVDPDDDDDEEEEGEDDDDDEEDFIGSEDEQPRSKGKAKPTSKPNSKLSKPSSKSKPAMPKKSQRVVTVSDDKDGSDVDDADSDHGNSKKRKNRDDDEPSPPSPASSALSSVYDEPPRKKGSGDSAKAKDAPKRKSKDPNEGLSADEARIAELKKFVVACGMRKQWSKEFADYPTPRAQISHLQSLLQSLGMKGTPTLAKARPIKEKRELAAELNDVKEFEAARGVDINTGRARRGAARVNYAVDDGGSDVEDEPKPKKKSSTMAAVMDFLDDDDDDAGDDDADADAGSGGDDDDDDDDHSASGSDFGEDYSD